MRKVFEEEGIEIVFDAEDVSRALWNTTLNQMSYIPTLYLSTSLDYQRAYMQCFLDEIIDISVIFKIKGRVLGLWPLSVNSLNGKIQVRTNQGAVLPPVFVKNTSEKVMRKIARSCLSALDSVHVLIGADGSGTWQSTSPAPESTAPTTMPRATWTSLLSTPNGSVARPAKSFSW